jgi:ABC-type multidrug transport system ATPase subunit
MHEPAVLLLDEPDTGLDLAAFGLLEAILTTNPRHAVVLTTHNLAAGLRLGTRVAMLSRGRIVYEQTEVALSDAQELASLLQRHATA